MILKYYGKVCRPRVTVWVSFGAIIICFLAFLKLNEISLAFYLAAALLFLFVCLFVIAISYYKINCFKKDFNRWNNKAAWKNEGLQSKLEVISDWIIR